MKSRLSWAASLVVGLALCASARAAEVVGVRVEPQKAGGAVLIIEADAEVRFTTFRLAAMEGKSERVVVDVQDCGWKEGYAEAQVGAGGVIGWRASLFADDPPVTRVVVDLVGGDTFRVSSPSPTKTIRVEIGKVDPAGVAGGAHPDDGGHDPWGDEGPDDPPDAPPPPPATAKFHLRKVEIVTDDDERFDLRIACDAPSDPVAFLFTEPALFVLDIPGAAPDPVKDSPEGWVDGPRGNSEFVNRVRILEIREDNLLSSRLVIDLDRPTPYDLSRDPSTPNAWRLSLRTAPSYKGLVVVDPGHGGRETGTHIGGLAEEELTLEIALRLRKKLLDRGIAAVLTRTAATTSDLWTRPYIANEIRADLFLSIHLNSGAPRTGGTETYYTHESGRAFAQAVQSALVRALGTKDRGIQADPEMAVTRWAEVPAVLTELIFQDYEPEARQIVKPEYQDKAAEALANAIEQALRAKGTS